MHGTDMDFRAYQEPTWLTQLAHRVCTTWKSMRHHRRVYSGLTPRRLHLSLSHLGCTKGVLPLLSSRLFRFICSYGPLLRLLRFGCIDSLIGSPTLLYTILRRSRISIFELCRFGEILSYFLFP